MEDKRAESLKRMIKGFKAHANRVQTQLDAHETKKKEEAMAKLFKEDIDYSTLYFAMKGNSMLEARNEKMLGRYRIVHKVTGEVLGSHDDKSTALKLGNEIKRHHSNIRLKDSEKED